MLLRSWHVLKHCLLPVSLLFLALQVPATPIHITEKFTAIGTQGTGDTTLYPDSKSAEFLWRTRLSSSWAPARDTHVEAALEESDRWASTALQPAVVKAPVPYRSAQLKWATMDETRYFESFEVDRASYSLRRGDTTVTLGRQAIGLGRGVLFNAMDVLLPFSPLDIDREWRPGVDAAVVDTRLSNTANAGGIVAFGRTWNDSAALVKLSGYRVGADGILVVGKRAQDAMLGASVSAPVGGAEAHAEWVTFRLPADEAGAVPGWGPSVNKAVLGASTVLPGKHDVYLLGEYHYNGFGARTTEALNTLLTTPEFQRRLARGDMQILGREGVAFQASAALDMARTASLTWVGNPRDGSGVIAPAYVWNINDNNTLLLSARFPYGRTSTAGVLRSEYGATPTSLAVQLTVYQ